MLITFQDNSINDELAIQWNGSATFNVGTFRGGNLSNIAEFEVIDCFTVYGKDTQGGACTFEEAKQHAEDHLRNPDGEDEGLCPCYDDETLDECKCGEPLDDRAGTMLWNFWRKHEKLSCKVDELKGVVKLIRDTTDFSKFGADDNPDAFYVDERYCSHMDIEEPVLVFAGWVIGGDEVDLFFGHCNPYKDDEFTQSSLETFAEDLNASLESQIK